MVQVFWLGLAAAVIIFVDHDVWADSESPSTDEYWIMYAPEYFMDKPASWTIQPSTRPVDFFSALFLELTNTLSDTLQHTLINGRTDSIVDVSAVQEYSDSPPTIRITVGPSDVPSSTFSQHYKLNMLNLYRADGSVPYITHENVTQAGGIVNSWYINTPDDPPWHRAATYTLVANGTAYAIVYTADIDTYDENYRHFERAVSSFWPIDTGMGTTEDTTVPADPDSPEDPRCMGTANCIVGKVTRVIDGDTLHVDDVRVRLALLDTAEPGTPEGDTAQRIVTAVCQIGSHATIDEDDGQTEGSYGRMLGVVWCGSVNLNEFLVDIGYGSIVTRYCQVSEFYREMWAETCRQ